ncbi:uncharacterized protein LOC131935023 isoform X2 [Physella acuta]|uniref:uncharacterized protein LOC131935023 isoform X2 n=1 Tax=Physella acuta TaxID=109671 RepID=UPI0027DC3A58|nr:uncharacterized protein LOC131935023 isoform X2 [Physella acuta]
MQVKSTRCGLKFRYENPVKLTVRTPLRLTKAVLDTTDGSNNENERILIFASKDNVDNIAICSLSCVNDNDLNLLLTYDEEVTFKLDKPGEVWLSGYYKMDDLNLDEFEPALETILEKKTEGGDN